MNSSQKTTGLALQRLPDTTQNSMTIREAHTGDIQQIQFVRNSVKENVLTDPGLVTDEDCRIFLTERGKGWVCEKIGQIVGFSIADLKDHNIWALFVHPDFERQGIGKQLHDTMLNWYFSMTKKTVWLGTAPNTRAEIFYRKAGWKAVGKHGKGEIKFEMMSGDWEKAAKEEIKIRKEDKERLRKS